MSKTTYTMTDESITVVHKGDTHTIKKGDKNFERAREAVFNEDWDIFPSLVSKGIALEKWAGGYFTFKDNHMHFRGERIPAGLNGRMLKMAAAGDDPGFLLKFWERLQANPSYRSVQQLYDFLTKHEIPIDQDGHILTYKSVTKDYKDHHSKSVDNSIGVVNEMARNRISDDPKVACHEGFHVGALGYTRTFGSSKDRQIIICKVDPADVVCVPYDESQQKMRVCRYKVIGHHGADLPGTTMRSPRVANPRKSSKKKADKADQVMGKLLGGSEATDVDQQIGKLLKETWSDFGRLRESGLRKQSLTDLRKYARHNLNIIGASKIPGGKDALLDKILEIRENRANKKTSKKSKKSKTKKA